MLRSLDSFIGILPPDRQIAPPQTTPRHLAPTVHRTLGQVRSRLPCGGDLRRHEWGGTAPGTSPRRASNDASVQRHRAHSLANAAKTGRPRPSGILRNATIEGGLACVFYGPSSPTPHTPNAAQPDSVRVVVVKGPSLVHGLQVLTGGACRADFRLRRPGLLRWIRVAQHPQDRYLRADRGQPRWRPSVTCRRRAARDRHPGQALVGVRQRPVSRARRASTPHGRRRTPPDTGSGNGHPGPGVLVVGIHQP